MRKFIFQPTVVINVAELVVGLYMCSPNRNGIRPEQLVGGRKYELR
jgi:hypothetical protein